MRKSEIRLRMRKVKIVVLGFLLGTLITLGIIRILPIGEKFFEPSPELAKRIHSYAPNSEQRAQPAHK